MSDEESIPKAEEDSDKKDQIAFELLKSNYFRVVYADGVFGGRGPRGPRGASGLLRMTFFNERWPLPTRIVHKISKEGIVGDEIGDLRVGRKAIVRELEAEIVMDFEVARQLAKWITDKLDNAENNDQPETGVDSDSVQPE